MNAEIRRLKIISGGQTGADRAALDVALTLSLPIGGWCPKGRRAEDGMIPDRYPLTETPEADYDTRTRSLSDLGSETNRVRHRNCFYS